METTITTITAIFIALAMIAAWMAYEMTHAYELPEDEDEDGNEDEENKTERNETKSNKEDKE